MMNIVKFKNEMKLNDQQLNFIQIKILKISFIKWKCNFIIIHLFECNEIIYKM